jgi:predicted short-subunit dehydrogenase-like oxidoreductase (DUF2520 family)
VLNIIGAGRLGTALAIALSRRGYTIQNLVGRRLAKTRKSAALLDAPTEVLAAKQIDRLQLSEITIIATPDDQIATVVDALKKLNGTSTFLHTSGALSSEVLKKLSKNGSYTGSIHPLLSVSDPVSGANSFAGAYWCVEGDRSAVRKAKQLISDMNGRSFSIDTKAKPLYHASALMTAGGVVALFDVALEMLTECGLERNEAQRVLLPLLESTVANLKRSETPEALTGTFARGDMATVDRHLRALSGSRLKDASQLYRLLGLRSLMLSEQNGLRPNIRKQIEKQLKLHK